MRDGWRRLSLADIAETTLGRQLSPGRRLGVRPRQYLRAANVQNGAISLKDVLLMDFTTDEETRFALRPGDVLLVEGGNENSVGCPAIVTDREAGLCFQNTLVRVRVRDWSECSPQFLCLALDMRFRDGRMAGMSTGTTIAHLGATRVPRIEIDVPPLAEQRRIVDLIATLDHAVGAAKEAGRRIVQTRRSVLLDMAESFRSDWVPLTHALTHVIGGAWGDSAGTSDIDVDALNLLVFSSPTSTVDPQYSSRRSLSRARLASRSIEQDDILLERSGGTDDQAVGRVVRAAEALPGVVPTDFMRLLRVDPMVAEPRYVFWWLWARYQRGDTHAFQSKTTNIRNLRVGDYLALPIRLPSRADQRALVALGESFTDAIEAAGSVAARLDALRGAVLTDLLSGDHEIPASYDRFLDGAA